MTTLASTRSGSLDATSTAPRSSEDSPWRCSAGARARRAGYPAARVGYRLAAGLLERADVLAVGFGADRSR